MRPAVVALKRAGQRLDTLTRELRGFEMKLRTRIVERRVDAYTVATQGAEVVGRRHAGRLDRVGLEVADPHDPGSRVRERGRDIRRRAGGQHTREQRAGSQQADVRMLDRLQHGARDRWALGDEAKPADPRAGCADRRFPVDELTARLTDE